MKTLLIAIPLMLMANVCWGANLLIESVSTTDLPGFTTYTLSILTDQGESFRGVDAEIRGPLSQVNPLGIATVFNDANGFFPLVLLGGLDVSQDSQFLFNSADVLSIGAEESDTLLKAAISGIERLGIQEDLIPFAQVVTDMPSCVEYRLAFDLGGNEPVIFQSGGLQLTPDDCIPEPTAALLATLALAMFSAQRRPIQ